MCMQSFEVPKGPQVLVETVEFEMYIQVSQNTDYYLTLAVSVWRLLGEEVAELQVFCDRNDKQHTVPQHM